MSTLMTSPHAHTPGSVTDGPSFRGDVALRAFCLEGKNKGELRRIGGADPLVMPYDSDCTVNLVAAQVPDPALVGGEGCAGG
jgi:hypothetical protein